MTRRFQVLLLAGLLAVGVAACQNNVLKSPDSDYDPSAALPTNMM